MELFGLLHGSFEPLAYAIAITLGLVSMAWKIKRGLWAAFITELGVFILIFKLHGGSMTGGFAATIAALLCGIIIPWMFRRKS